MTNSRISLIAGLAATLITLFASACSSGDGKLGSGGGNPGAGGATSGSGSSTSSVGSGGGGEGGGGVLKGDCSSANPLGCYRGMYLSLWTDHIGQVTFEGETEPYRQILGDPKIYGHRWSTYGS